MALITAENTESLHQTLRITLQETDYADNYKKALLNAAKKVHLPGFRAGKVPAKVIEKMYGKSLLIEELVNIAQNQLFTYLQEHKIAILYQPLLVEEDIKNENTDKSYQFAFEIGLRPKIDLNFVKTLRLKAYKVHPKKSAIEQEIEYSTYYFAQHNNVEEVSDKEKDQLIGNLKTENEQDQPFTLYLKNVTPESFEKKFKLLQKDATVTIAEKDILPEFTKHYNRFFTQENDKKEITFHITEIKNIVPHALNEALYEKVFPQTEIKTKEDFTAKLAERMQKALDKESNEFLAHNLSHILQEREAITLPTTFIQKWEQANQKEKKEPKIFTEKDWQELYKAIRYHLIEQEVIENQKITCSKEELSDFIKNEKFKQQFAQYNLPETTLNQLLVNAMEDQKYLEQATNELTRKKAIAYLLTQIQKDTEEVDNEAFLNLVKKHFETHNS